MAFRVFRLSAFALICIVSIARGATPPTDFNVRDFGARGDGVSLDSAAINAAIEAASSAGGGTVYLPAGRYLSFSIRIKSNLTLHLEAGAIIVAADPAGGLGHYDAAEPNAFDLYQDFGHSHWQNSLLWGDGLVNVSIVGSGEIDGSKGLTRRGPPARRAGEESDTTKGAPAAPAGEPRSMDGLGNKAIALKNCRNVTLRDFSILNGGHFALLATGVDQLTIDNVKVDTNRDGFDIDCCRYVLIANCSINTPHDDAIVFKSSFGLGEIRATENITVTNCIVSGYDIGTMLDGTYQRTMTRAPDRDGPTGRIKIGTESNGAFRNITISNCVFVRSRGLALETVDGGVIEDVTITNLAMREIVNSPIFIRLGNRARGPEGTPVGAIRRVQISHLTASDCDARYPVVIAGLPNHPIEDVTLSDIHLVSRGGLSLEQVAQQPAELVNPFFLRGKEAGVTGPREPFAVPERETAYPEPSMFGLLPSSAVYARHVRNLTVRNFVMSFAQPDLRPAVVLDDVVGVTLESFRLPRDVHRPTLVLRQVREIEISRSTFTADTHLEQTDSTSF